jgi:cytochrome b6-f complex iron-sulfur subunit
MKEAIEKENATIDRKDFMKQVGMGFGAIMLLNCLQSCAEKDIPDPTPGVTTGKVDFSINITDAANTALGTKGGFLVVKDKKVIIARTNADTWIAVSSACTHEGTTVGYRKASDDFLCPNHGAEFKNTGAVQKGPATKALTKYNVTFTANSNMVRVFE